MRALYTASLAVIACGLLAAGCGGSSGDDAKADSAKKTGKPAAPITVPEDKLKDAVGDPQNNASYVSNMIAQCFDPIAAKKAGLDKEADCSDPTIVAKINPTYAATLKLGEKPGGTTIEAESATDFSATARSIDVDGIGVTEWTYFRSGSTTEYKSRCTPEIKKYCVKGKIVPYYG